MTRRQASTAPRIVIPAASLAEFLAGAVACYGGLRRAAVGIDIPYSTLRGWLHGRYRGAGDRGNAFINALTGLWDDLTSMSGRLDALDHILGRESGVRK